MFEIITCKSVVDKSVSLSAFKASFVLFVYKKMPYFIPHLQCLYEYSLVE